MLNLFFNYHFRPVGQGLFAHGSLWQENASMDQGEEELFTWIYDCGTKSPISVLNRQIDRFHHLTKANLDLLIVSHFDEDHLAGLRGLAAGKKIDVLVLPYLTLAQRLHIISGLGLALLWQVSKRRKME